jgi:hypothetical protein
MSDHLALLVQRSREHQPALRPLAQTAFARWEAPAHLPEELDAEVVAEPVAPQGPGFTTEPAGEGRQEPQEPAPRRPVGSPDAPHPPKPTRTELLAGGQQAVAPPPPITRPVPTPHSPARPAPARPAASTPPAPAGRVLPNPRAKPRPATQPATPERPTVEVIATKPVEPPARPVPAPKHPPAASSVVPHRPAEAPPVALPPPEASPGVGAPIRPRLPGHTHTPAPAPAPPPGVTPPAHPAEPAPIRVSIGRIEVRGVPPPAAPGHSEFPGPRRPPLSLDDYLRERSGSSR